MRHRSPGRYEILQLLGEGPYGSVSLARDGFAANRLVAVKVLDKKLLPSRAFMRLQREFMLRRSVHNPRLAAFYDLDFDDSGNCRLVSEYAGGKDFLEAAAALGPDGLIDLAVQLLHALGHLHDCGLVHGAVKPTNIRLAGDAGPPCLKLLDFDLRPDHEVSPSPPAHTLHHAAPEVLRGQAPDHGADLYAVGMLLHQAVAGRLPFDDPGHAPGVVAWHLSKSVQRAPPGHALTPVIEGLLDPEPERRFKSTHEVVRAIAAACGRRLRSRATRGGEQVLVSGRFIGRERETTRLSTACRRIVTGGGAQLFLLLAPQGMGKSRALDECRVLAQMAGVRVVQAACGGERSAPLGALRQLVRQIVVLIGTDHELVETHLRVLREVVPDLLGAWTPRTTPLGPEHEWLRIKNGLAEFLASVAQLRPLMMLLDDIQFLDEASLAVLRWAYQHFSACPLMVVGALEETPAGEPAPPSAGMLEHDAHEVLRLGPLEAGDVEQVLAGILALPGSIRDLSSLVLRLTGGVPLYVEELVRALLEGQMFDLLAEDPAALDAEDSRMSPRERALALIESRLDRLPEDAAAVMEALSLFETPAAASDLAVVLGRTAAELDSAVGRLERADLVRTEWTCFGPRIAIKSSLFRDAVERRISPEKRASLHDHIADCLEAHAPDSPDRTAALAYHRTNGILPESALSFCTAAARDAMSRHAFGRARVLLERATQLAARSGDADATRTILDLLASTLLGLGETDGALAVLTDLASEVGAARTELFSARLRIAAIQADHGRTSAAERTLAEAAREAGTLGDPLLLSQAERQRAALLLPTSPDRALAVLERVRDVLAGLDRLQDLARVVGEIGEAHQQLGEPAKARTCHLESLRRCLGLRDQFGIALAHLHLALLDWHEGRGAAALARSERSARLSRRMGHYPLLARALHVKGVVEAELGRLSDAVRTLTQGVAMMRRIGDDSGVCDGLFQLAAVHHAAGRHEMARMLVEDVAGRRSRLNDLGGVAAARVMLGRILCVLGALDEAEALLRTAADATQQLDLGPVAADALRGLAEVALRRGLTAEAASCLDREAKIGCRRPDRAATAASALIRARIACEEAPVEARTLLAGLLRGARSSRNAYLLGEARRLAGGLRHGGSALASLGSAQRCADRAGFRELAWRVRADLGRRLLDEGDVALAGKEMKEGMVLLRSLHDELPVRRREEYLADPHKQELRASFAQVVDRLGVPAA